MSLQEYIHKCLTSSGFRDIFACDAINLSPGIALVRSSIHQAREAIRGGDHRGVCTSVMTDINHYLACKEKIQE